MPSQVVSRGSRGPASRATRAALAWLLCALVALAAAEPAAAVGIDQLPGTAGCVVAASVPDCAQQPSLASPSDIVVLGTHVYVSDAGASRIDIYDRDPLTGALTPRAPGPDGCIADDGAGTGCRDARWLSNPGPLAASPDGGRLYAGFERGGVTTLVRNPATGGLTQTADADSCVASVAAELSGTCAVTATIFAAPAGLAVSPDGADVYVVGSADGNGFVGLLDIVAGGLAGHAQAAGGCAQDNAAGSACLDARAMGSSQRVVVSPDGAHVYVTNFGSSSVVGLTRAADGALGLIAGLDGCLQQPGGDAGCRESTLIGAETSPIAFASNTSGYVGGRAGAYITLIARNPATGGLTTSSCVASNANLEPCSQVQDLFGVQDFALTADRSALVVAARFGRGLHIFRLAGDGSLAAVAPPGGCLATGGIGATTSCTLPHGFAHVTGAELGPGAVALGPGGPFAYGVSPAELEDGAGIVAVRRTLADPVCHGATVDVAAGAGVALPLRCTDGDEDPIALSVVQAPARGTLGSVDQGAATVGYVAPADGSGTETLAFKGTANGTDSAPAAVTIQIAAAAAAPPEPPPAPPPEFGDKDGDGIPDALDTSDASVGPTLAKTAIAELVQGKVYVRRPGARSTRQVPPGLPPGSVPLKGAEVIPFGSTLYTDLGRVALTTASTTRTGANRLTQRAVFYAGVFKITQRRALRPITDLTLDTKDFAKLCTSYGKSATGARAAAAGGSRSKKVVSRLRADGKGRFRTKGRNSAATVRGTQWLTEDRCDGTLTRVTRGSVSVLDLRARRTVIVRAGHSYLARAVRATVKTKPR